MGSIDLKWMGEEARADIMKRLDIRLETAVKRVADATKAQLPRDTGTLAESVETIVEDGKLKAYWGTDVEYASDVEFGTRKQAPDGTWRRVTEESKPMIKNTLTGNQ